MDHSSNNEEAKLLICLNNMGVKEFERGNTEKAVKLFTLGLTSALSTPDSLQSLDRKLRKKHTLKLAKVWSRSTRHNKFGLLESSIFGACKERRKNKTGAPNNASSQDDCVTFKYNRVLRIMVSRNKPILKQTSTEKLTGVILLNLAISNHNSSSEDYADAARYYELAFCAFSICGDLYPQLIIWNNLWHLYSDDLNREDAAFICQRQLESKLSQLHARGLLQHVGLEDRAGFLSNIKHFSSTPTVLFASAA